MSLRLRVTLVSVAVLAVALGMVSAFVYASLRSRTEGELHDRLRDRAGIAARLVGRIDAQTLADRLSTEGTRVVVRTNGREVLGVPQAPVPVPTPPTRDRPATTTPLPAPVAPGRASVTPTTATPVPSVVTRSPATLRVVPRSAVTTSSAAASAAVARATIRTAGPVLTLDTRLTAQTTLHLSVVRADQERALSRLLVLEIVGSLAALAVAALALWRVLGLALRPLDDMTALAVRIAREMPRPPGERLARRRSDTELGRLAVAFDEMLDAQESALGDAQRAEGNMRRFLADASHELRNPVAGIQATGETLLRDGEDRDRREALTVTLVRESRRASRLVGDLLTAARAESERGLERRPLDLAEVVREAAQRDAPLDHPVALELDAPESVVVLADADRVAQVVGALVDNARRASPGGRVRLAVARAGPGAVLEVHDDGPGVAEADRERIFGRFVQLGGRDRRGSGLGLTIARSLAEAHGGTLTCGTSPLGGALLRLWLPVGRASGPTTMC